MRDLETDRVLIRAFRPDDLSAFAALMHTAFNTSPDPSAHREILTYHALADRVLAQLHQPPYGDRALVLKTSRTLVGAVGFVPCLAPFAQLPSRGAVPNARFTPELGLFWALAPDHRGLGLATEAARAMLRYAFDHLHAARVVATTDADNAPSIAVMRRLGMTVERNPFPTPAWFQTVGTLDAPLPNV
jgi:RimJ/RimL family protein N-acetyltransferase